ncbi:hypothetical protein SAMN05216323_100922 [Williamwhitmania taraxaci]|uniref:Uncharacterized protein n=1 Tax=Williamwhitmania taraxaci TaxID=1640674 RepID=A0A1G6HBF6_9BACT|nr:hypothetical protein SAMN05216323_100922 [Williamwhitmania taraxaci]
MKKRLQILILSFYASGLLIKSLSSIYRDEMSKMILGFCEGISLVFILLGFAYMCWCLAKNRTHFQ